MLELHFSPHLIHPSAAKICRVLQEHDYQAFIVGGCIRDLILGLKPKDWDICTDATPKKIMEIFPKNIPTGLQHGTITVCMGEGVENHFEVTTFRVEGEYSDGRRPDEVFFVMNVEQDLARRDLTINAIAYDPINHQISDPFNGLQDLKNHLIKAVGKPDVRFQEDGLRIMRVARFAARFGYSVDQPTFEGMKNSIDILRKVSRERIRDELSKILLSKDPSYGLQLLQKCKALDIACPLLAERQLPFLSKQTTCKGDLETQLAFLYNKLPLDSVKEDLLNLKFSSSEIKKTMFLMSLINQFFIFEKEHTALAYKHFMAFLKNNSTDSWENTLKQFLQLAESMELAAQSLLEEFRDQIVIPRKEMKINGDHLLNAGMTPGPRIKQTLDACYLEILREPNHNNLFYLLEIARKY